VNFRKNSALQNGLARKHITEIEGVRAEKIHGYMGDGFFRPCLHS